MIKNIIAGKGGTPVEINTYPGEDAGLVVATRPHKEFTSKTAFFTNDTYGREMAQDAAFGAVAWTLADGGDTTEADSGTADTNTLNHVIEAGQNFQSTVCVGMTASATTDATVTVVNSDTDLTCDGDPCPLGSEAYTIGPAWTFSEPVGTKWVDGDTGQFHNGSASILCDNANVNDIMQLINVNATDVICSYFTAISMWIYVDNNWITGDSVSLYGHVGGVLAGNKVYLEDYFDYTEHDIWHYVIIPLADMGLSTDTIDAIRFENESRAGAKSPKFWIDEIILQPSGSPIEFSVIPDKGTWFHVTSYQTVFVDTIDCTTNGPSHDQILGMTPTVGYLYERYNAEETDPIFTFRVLNLLDLMSLPHSRVNYISDGTDTIMIIAQEQPEELILKAENSDKMVIILEDDFNNLLYFRVSVQGYVEQR